MDMMTQVQIRDDFTKCIYSWKRYESNYSPSSNVGGRGGTCDVMVKVMDYRIVISEFERHFHTYTLEKAMKTLIFPAMG